VLDPFLGAGTTGMVALQEGRDFLGIELNSDYAALARERIDDAQQRRTTCAQQSG
jgi:site-specific DNA-methyltransferase (adenine-specific)